MAPEDNQIIIESESPKAARPEDNKESNLQELFLKVKEKLEPFLPKRWMTIVDAKVLHVVKVSLQKCSAIQRSLIVSDSGMVDLFVHNQSANMRQN